MAPELETKPMGERPRTITRRLPIRPQQSLAASRSPFFYFLFSILYFPSPNHFHHFRPMTNPPFHPKNAILPTPRAPVDNIALDNIAPLHLTHEQFTT